MTLNHVLSFPGLNHLPNLSLEHTCFSFQCWNHRTDKVQGPFAVLSRSNVERAHMSRRCDALANRYRHLEGDIVNRCGEGKNGTWQFNRECLGKEKTPVGDEKHMELRWGLRH